MGPPTLTAQGFKGLGFRVQGLGFRVQGLGFRAKGLGFSGLYPALCLATYVPQIRATATIQGLETRSKPSNPHNPTTTSRNRRARTHHTKKTQILKKPLRSYLWKPRSRPCGLNNSSRLRRSESHVPTATVRSSIYLPIYPSIHLPIHPSIYPHCEYSIIC